MGLFLLNRLCGVAEAVVGDALQAYCLRIEIYDALSFCEDLLERKIIRRASFSSFQVGAVLVSVDKNKK